MATFTYTPDYNAQESCRPNIRRVQFGDGYEQAIAFGLNTQPVTWNLTFANRSNTERDNILTFFRTQGGFDPFDWTPPYGSAGKYICEEWSTTMVAYNINTIQATFRQVYEP